MKFHTMPKQTWEEFRANKISRQLAMVLRHDIEKRKLKMNKKGFVKVKDLLELDIFAALNTTLQDIINAVYVTDKSRFDLKQDIRKQ